MQLTRFQQHRTGSIIGCLRKLQGWDLDSIIAEYISFSHPKSRVLDEKFIEAFDVSKLAHLSHALMSPLPWNIPTTPRLVPVEDTKELSPPTWYLHSSPMNRVDVDVSQQLSSFFGIVAFEATVLYDSGFKLLAQRFQKTITHLLWWIFARYLLDYCSV